ncbi:MAG: hypothetical protein K0S12_1902 [Bacteroidetes bacterium]|jgi:hypothetical protein|nr:hypothetical protein [Bacteroidota bacterium]
MRYFSIAVLVVTLCSCNSSTTSGTNETPEHRSEATIAESPKFKDVDTAVALQLDQVIQHYIRLKNSLVASNSLEAQASAKHMFEAILSVDTLKFTPEHKKVYNSQIGIIKENVSKIMESDNIVRQRDHLNPLSESTFKLIKSFGSTQPVYFEFCPMANDDKGGYWVSESPEVMNPYFGDEMLNCGEVKETLK